MFVYFDRVLKQTPNATLFENQEGAFWAPRSVYRFRDNPGNIIEGGVLELPNWFRMKLFSAEWADNDPDAF